MNSKPGCVFNLGFAGLVFMLFWIWIGIETALRYLILLSIVICVVVIVVWVVNLLIPD